MLINKSVEDLDSVRTRPMLEELVLNKGMGENLDLPEREAVRTPMQWSSEHNGGFSLASRVPNPVITGGVYGCEQVNVEKQRRDPQSFLNWLVRMQRVRILAAAEHPAVRPSHRIQR